MSARPAIARPSITSAPGIPAALIAHPRLTALLAAICIAFSGILVRFADVEPSTAAFFRCFYALPLLLPLAIAEERQRGPRTLRDRSLAVIAGVAFATDLILYHHAIALVGAGLATVLANLQAIFVAVAAWLLLGERLRARVLVALALALLGVVLVSGVLVPDSAGAYGAQPALGSALGVFTALSYAVFLFCLRIGNREGRIAGPAFEATLAATVGIAAGGLLLGELDVVPAWPSHGWLLLLALSAQVGGSLFTVISLPRLPAALTSLILLAQPVGTVALAFLLLQEYPSPLQVVGVAFVLLGLAFARTGAAPGGAPAQR